MSSWLRSMGRLRRWVRSMGRLRLLMVDVLDLLNAMWSLMTGCVLFVQGPVIARWNLVFMSLTVIEVGIGLLMIEDVM